MTSRPYDVPTFEKALNSVRSNIFTTSAAAREFGVPRKTLDNHVRGIYSNHSHGPARMLEEDEEAAIVNYIVYMAEQGFPMTRAMTRAYIVSILRQQQRRTLFNLEKGPSDKWFRAFFARHPQLTERVPEKYDRARSRMSNINVMTQFFDLLEATVDRLDIRDKPHRIFNADETGWSGKEKTRKKVIGVKGRHAYQQSNTPSGHVTAHLCVAADGRVLPTFLIFEKSLPHSSYKDTVPGTWMYAKSDSGYMNTELFIAWFEGLFLKHCGSERPVLLVMDNHDSHVNLEVVKLARENDVELLGLPPHTTHILQPLDVSINGPIKQKLSTMAANLGFLNKKTVLNKAKFPAILSNTIDHVCSTALVKGAFRKCGLYPVDRDAIDSTQLTPSLLPTSKGDAATTTTTEGSEQTPRRDGTTCTSCGSFFGVNPLVKEGLIPESLSQLFPPVPAKTESVRRKLVLEARVITSDDFQTKLEEKVKEAAMKQELQDNKRQERERRRQEKEIEKEKKASKKRSIEEKENRPEKRKQEKGKKEKQTKKAKTNELSVEEENDDVVCCMCELREPDCLDALSVAWIACDQCERWYHSVCVGIESDESMTEVYFVCMKCCE